MRRFRLNHGEYSVLRVYLKKVHATSKFRKIDKYKSSTPNLLNDSFIDETFSTPNSSIALSRFEDVFQTDNQKLVAQDIFSELNISEKSKCFKKICPRCGIILILIVLLCALNFIFN